MCVECTEQDIFTRNVITFSNFLIQFFNVGKSRDNSRGRSMGLLAMEDELRPRHGWFWGRGVAVCGRPGTLLVVGVRVVHSIASFITFPGFKKWHDGRVETEMLFRASSKNTH